MMTEPTPDYSTQEEAFEWAEENGVLVKITSKNANGRKCGCGCPCPCKCSCCKWRCCRAKKK